MRLENLVPSGCARWDALRIATRAWLRLASLAVSVLVVACTSSAELALSVYDGEFECTEVDGDVAVLLWDDDEQTGWFGWVPSGGNAFVIREIGSLSIDATFNDVYGVAEPDEPETTHIAAQLTLQGDQITGPGTLTRTGQASEACTFSFRRRE